LGPGTKGPWAGDTNLSRPVLLNSPASKAPVGHLVAQLVEHLTLDFSSDHDLRVLRWSPTVGSALSRESAGNSPSALPPTLAGLLSQINKLKEKRKRERKKRERKKKEMLPVCAV